MTRSIKPGGENSSNRDLIKDPLLIYYQVLQPKRLEVLRFREYSRADTNSRTEPLHQRVGHHAC